MRELAHFSSWRPYYFVLIQFEKLEPSQRRKHVRRTTRRRYLNREEVHGYFVHRSTTYSRALYAPTTLTPCCTVWWEHRPKNWWEEQKTGCIITYIICCFSWLQSNIQINLLEMEPNREGLNGPWTDFHNGDGNNTNNRASHHHQSEDGSGGRGGVGSHTTRTNQRGYTTSYYDTTASISNTSAVHYCLIAIGHIHPYTLALTVEQLRKKSCATVGAKKHPEVLV